jgi:acyl carrier protein
MNRGQPREQSQEEDDMEKASSTVEGIQRWLVAHLAEALDVNPSDLDVRKPLESYGMDSLIAETLVGDLEKWLGVRLPGELPYDYPTIESLARHLAEMKRPPG